MTDSRILVVEDEPSFAEALRVGLGAQGFEVVTVEDGGEALKRFDEIAPDLVLLDVMLPTMSGVDVCRELRNRSDVPIIMVTAKSEEIDAVVGLEVGADDYVTKPYRLRELVARIRSALRRAGIGATATDGGGEETEAQTIGDVTIDADSHEVLVRGEPVSLPLKEFELLHLLMSNPGRVLTREVLIDRIWGMDYVGDTKTLDVHVKRLRQKIEPDPRNPTRIVTIRGLGYKFERPRTPA